MASLLASSGAGLLWHIGGASLAFGTGTVLASLVVLMILFGRIPQAGLIEIKPASEGHV